MNRIDKFMNNVCNAVGTMLIDGNIVYSGVNGHKRFAREFGVALYNFDKEEQQELIKCSYDKIYVKSCFLKPILSAKEWTKEVINSFSKK